MKKTIIVLSILVFVAFGGLITLFILTLNQRNLSPPLSQQDAGSQILANEDLASELAYLQEQLQVLLEGGADIMPAGISLISDQQAEDIAIAFLGYGTVANTILFIENGVYTFEVDMRHGYVRYMVYVNAADGSIVRMNRFENDNAPPEE